MAFRSGSRFSARAAATPCWWRWRKRWRQVDERTHSHPEARPGFAGACPSVGGLGAMSGPPGRSMDLTPNLPEVVAEVRERFERYEQALIDKNVDVLDGTFWQSPH